MNGFETVEQLYRWSSSINFFGGISHPIVFINSKDDPLIPDPLLEPVRQFASKYLEHQSEVVSCSLKSMVVWPGWPSSLIVHCQNTSKMYLRLTLGFA